MIGESPLWYLGMLTAAAAWTLSLAEEKTPDPNQSGFERPLNHMLVRLMAGTGIGMLTSLSIYLSGLVIPALMLICLAAASLLARKTLRLIPFYRFKMGLALAGLLAGITYWLNTLAAKEPFNV